MRLKVALFVLVIGFSGTAVAQTYNTFYAPGGGQHTLWAYCYGINTGQIVLNCNLVIETTAYAGTNAHFHYNISAPHGTFVCAQRERQCSPYSGTRVNANTSGWGSVQFDLSTTNVGQAERVAATPTAPGSQGGYMDYVSGYQDIYWNDHPEVWYQVGGTTQHGGNEYNHWMRSAPARLSTKSRTTCGRHF